MQLAKGAALSKQEDISVLMQMGTFRNRADWLWFVWEEPRKKPQILMNTALPCVCY